MALYSFPWNQVNSLVQEWVEPGLIDEVFLSNALYYRIKSRTKTFDGGRAIQVNLNWKVEGDGGLWWGSNDKLPTGIVDTIQAATFSPVNAAVRLAITWDDLMTVRGKEMIRPLMEDKSEIAKNTAVKLVGDELFNDGTNVKAITGLQYALRNWTTDVDSGAAQLYGGITRQQTAAGVGTNLWWLHGADTTAYITGPTGTFVGAAGQGVNGALPKAFARVKLKSGKKPTLLIGNVGGWTDFHNHLTSGERYDKARQNSALYDAGFDNVLYRGAPYVADEAAPRGASPTFIEKVYALYEPGIRFYVHEAANMTWTGFREPHDQMGKVGYFLWRGQLVFVEPRAQHVIQSVDTSAVS